MDYCTEYYLTCPVFETRKIICKFRTSDHPLAIETGRYKNIPREFRLCNLCKTLEDESHFFLYCKINDNIRTELFEKFNIDCKNNDAETILKNILNPSSPQQVNSLSTFIKRSLELRTGGT